MTEHMDDYVITPEGHYVDRKDLQPPSHEDYLRCKIENDRLRADLAAANVVNGQITRERHEALMDCARAKRKIEELSQ